MVMEWIKIFTKTSCISIFQDSYLVPLLNFPQDILLYSKFLAKNMAQKVNFWKIRQQHGPKRGWKSCFKKISMIFALFILDILKEYSKNGSLWYGALSNILNTMAPVVPPKNFLLLLSVRQRETFHEALFHNDLNSPLIYNGSQVPPSISQSLHCKKLPYYLPKF